MDFDRAIDFFDDMGGDCGGKMRQDVRDYWAERLESGEYKQGKGRLRLGNKFCCLGVLCDLGQSAEGSWVGDEYIFKGWKQSHMIAPQVAKLAGLSDYAADALAELNDNGASFKTIARVIRERL